MARAPEVNENFLREVDEEVRRDQALRVWRQYGKWIIAGLVAALLALGGWLWWQNARAKEAEAAGERLSIALGQLEAGNAAAATPALEELAKGGAEGPKIVASMALAAAALDKGDLKRAVGLYDGVATDTGAPQPYRDAATLRSVAAQFDTLPPAQSIDRLKGLALPGKPWFGSAGEMTAISYLRLGKRREAGELFGALARDRTVPATIRSRAVQLAGSMGIEVPADDKGNP